MQCCTCSKWAHFQCSPHSFSKFRTHGSSYSWSCTPCCVPASSENNTMTSLSDSSSVYTFTVQSAPYVLLLQHFRTILTFKPLVPLSPTWYLLSLHSHHRLMLLAVSQHLLLCLLPLTPSGFFNGMLGLRARNTELLHFISSHPVDLISIEDLTLIHLPLSRFLDSLLCDLIAPTPGLVFSLS